MQPVSVIMPTYNGSRYLAEALDSLVGEAGPAEVLVVDDGSTDDTVSIATRYGDVLPVRVIQPGRRGNWTAMANIGLRAARGPWAAILHQDDRWVSRRGRMIAPFLKMDVDLVLSDAEFIDEAGRVVGPWRIPNSVRRHPERLTAALYVQNWISVPAATFRTDAALGVGGLDEDLWYTADWDLWLKLSKRTTPACAPGAGASFRIHGQSQTVIGADRLRDQLEAVQARHRWAADTARTARAGRLSTETNILLGGALKGRSGVGDWARVAIPAVAAGAGWQYLKDSAVIERIGGRLRARLNAVELTA